MTASREETAERLLALRERIQRWGARDFKRTSAPLGLTQTQFAILAAVEAAEGLNLSALAERLDLAAPTIVRAVDALERKGLVTRSRSSRDHREVTIRLTPEGVRIHRQMHYARRERIVNILSGLNDDELDGLLRGYEALVRALESGDESARSTA